MSIYKFSAVDNKGAEVALKDYEGKVLLIINTATDCGFTPQYDGLEELYQKYKEQGFEILDFPCNQFLGQAPGTDDEIDTFCRLNYNTSFKRFSKIEVNGDGAHPLYVYLKEAAPEDYLTDELKAFNERMQSKDLGVEGAKIKWNFTKFLIDRQGKVVERFAPTHKPEDLIKDIEEQLAK
ncbi:MAG: glutathione peroxidase [Firmicutes bacterium]|jgi:glutathione peroxidase|nr:glutathione peroxidase [Bacillota bacterium]